MSLRRSLSPMILAGVRGHPRAKQFLKSVDGYRDLITHSVAHVLPQILQPDPREIFITLTANCNLRCRGCRYGRDFMAGSQLSWATIRDLLDDASSLGIKAIRFYGGEPLLHPDIVRAVEYSVHLGLNTWITTNGIVLRQKIDDLFSVGLRHVELGFYGVADEYDSYVQRKNQYSRMQRGVAYVRDRYGMAVSLALGWVLMRPNCTVDAVNRTWQFAKTYAAPFGVSLIHYSLPYFTEGPERELQFTVDDLPQIQAVVAELIRLKQAEPELILQTLIGLRSIPDWLIKGPNMRVPCDRRRLIWIGADGTVQLCYVTFKLGNLNQTRLSDLLFTPAHEQAARAALSLHCPNCHCNYDGRVRMDAASRLKYSH
jgi:MoaA/NifB/PqqE/SkfB family radical SAM enzyme